MVGGCDDGCYIWKLYDGSSDKSDKNSKIRLAYICDDFKEDIDVTSGVRIRVLQGQCLILTFYIFFLGTSYMYM